MTKPQQPELRRSGLGNTDQDSDKVNAENVRKTAGVESGVAPLPEDNQPGHHPEKEQDKPDLG